MHNKDVTKDLNVVNQRMTEHVYIHYSKIYSPISHPSLNLAKSNNPIYKLFISLLKIYIVYGLNLLIFQQFCK